MKTGAQCSGPKGEGEVRTEGPGVDVDDKSR